jgi:hypothetical protein
MLPKNGGIRIVKSTEQAFEIDDTSTVSQNLDEFFKHIEGLDSTLSSALKKLLPQLTRIDDSKRAEVLDSLVEAIRSGGL